jgi:hypothetical protein
MMHRAHAGSPGDGEHRPDLGRAARQLKCKLQYIVAWRLSTYPIDASIVLYLFIGMIHREAAGWPKQLLYNECNE